MLRLMKRQASTITLPPGTRVHVGEQVFEQPRFTVLEQIGLHYTIHPLVLETMPNTDQHPRIEEVKDSISIIVKCCVTIKLVKPLSLSM